MNQTQQNISEDYAKDVKKIAKGAGISFIGSITGKGLGFACQVIIARFFGAEVFGLYILGLVVLKITELFARFGLHTGAMRFVSIYRENNPGKVKGTILSAILISFIIGTFMGGIVYVSAGFVSDTIFHKPALTDIIKTFVICVPYMATMMVVAGTSEGFHTTKYSAYTRDIIQPSVNILCVIIFILLGFSIYGVIFAFVISHVIALLAGFCFVARQFPGIKERTLKPIYENKKLLKYSAPLLVSGFLIFLMSWTDVIMLGYMKTSTDVGIYRAASQIPILLILISTATNSIYAPIIAEIYHQNHMERLSKILKTTTRFVFFLTLPVTLIFVFSARDLMAIFGADYLEVGVPVLIVLAITQFINCATGGVGYTLIMTKKQNVEMINNLVVIAINIILNYFLISAYGAFGAAIATGISFGLINFVRLLELYIIYKIHPYDRKYIQGIVGIIIAIIILLHLHENFNNYPMKVNLILNTIVVCIIFIAILFVTCTKDEDRFIFNAFLNKLRVFFKV